MSYESIWNLGLYPQSQKDLSLQVEDELRTSNSLLRNLDTCCELTGIVFTQTISSVNALDKIPMPVGSYTIGRSKLRKQPTKRMERTSVGTT